MNCNVRNVTVLKRLMHLTKNRVFIVHTKNLFKMVHGEDSDQGPVVQSVVSLTSSLRVILLTVLADSIYNILIFFAETM